MARRSPAEKRVRPGLRSQGLVAEEVFDGMAGGHVDPEPDEAAGDAVADLKAELARAEAAEADALADAARARARASEVDRDLLCAAADESGSVEPVAPVAPVARPAVAQTVGLAVAALLAGVLLTLTGLMLWQHVKLNAQRDQERRYVDAARDGVVALLSMDYNHARADVQRVLDLSTGQFRDDFSRSADDFVKTAEDSKAVTLGTINAAALDGVDGDRARVLVAATSEVTNANGAKRDARPFRMSVTVARDGDECKMSDVEFVP